MFTVNNGASAASKQATSAAIALYAQTAMRFACGKGKTVMRYGKRVAVPLQRVARNVQGSAGLNELAANAQMQRELFETEVSFTNRWLHARTVARNVLPYANAAQMLRARNVHIA